MLRSNIATAILLALSHAATAQTVHSKSVSSMADLSPEIASATDAEMAVRVRQEFQHAWQGYKQYAWGHDELKPLSKSYHDWYAKSLLMTPVDALDTMMLMGMNDEAAKTRDYIATNLSFNPDIYVKNF